MKNTEFIKYANSFQSIAKLRLESITKLMNLLGNPQDDLKFIHIAGTNGKGSVCSFLQNILTDAGYTTGKYISPNMIRVNERISVDGIEISDNDLEKLLKTVEDKAISVKKETGDFPTQFEIWTAVAFCYFKNQNCDYVVLETGLGGRQDATNIIKNTIISVITRISSDHTEYLGNTLSEISFEKAGIIKKSNNNPITITVSQDEEIINVLSDVARNQENTFLITDDCKIHNYNNSNSEFFDYKDLKNIEIKLLGTHQAENASIAVECAKHLKIDEKYIREGLLKAKNPGRFEIISQNPTIIFDGAHNQNGMGALTKNLLRYFKDSNLTFIMGFMKDKDITNALSELKKENLNTNNYFYTVKVKNNERAMDADKLAKLLIENEFNTQACQTIDEALKLAKAKKTPIIICGSLYLYKDLFEIL